jgi:hypothetical protein
VLILLMVAAAAPQLESYQSNDTLRPLCAQQSVACAGYIEGVSDMLSALADRLPNTFGHLYCPPARVTPDDLRRKYLHLVKSQPEGGNFPAAESITDMLTTAYPCSK